MRQTNRELNCFSKKLISLFLFVICAVFFCGCGLINFDRKSESSKTELAAPANLCVENDIVMWSSVPNAGSYIVQIGDESTQALTREIVYPLSALLSDSRVGLYVRVKACPADPATFTESAWSALYGPFDYSANITSPPVAVEKNEALKKAKELRIGHGYDFVNDEYFNINKAKTNSVLDMEKVLDSAYLSYGQNANQTITRSVYSENIHEFISSVNLSSNSSISVGGKYNEMSAKVEAGLQRSFSIDYSQYSYSGFLNCYCYCELRNYQLLDYGDADTLSEMLSTNFLRAVKNTSIPVDRRAQNIIDNFGTHVILGMVSGGRLDYYYTFATNSSQIARAFKQTANAAIGVDVADIVSVSAKNECGVGFSESYMKGETVAEANFQSYGGSADAGSLNVNNIAEKFSSWKVDTSNERSMNINGAVSIADLIECIDHEPAVAVNKRIAELADTEYLALCKRFDLKVHDNTGMSAQSPYMISTAKDLNDIRYKDRVKEDGETFVPAYFRLANDIDMKGIDWTPINRFCGVLDGDGYAINNLEITENTGRDENNVIYSGFIGVNEGTVKNIRFDNLTISTSCIEKFGGRRDMYVGAIGYNLNNVVGVRVSNSNLFSTLGQYDDKNRQVSEYSFVGGIVGGNKGRISFCMVVGTTLDACADARKSFCFDRAVVGGIAGFTAMNSSISDVLTSDMKLHTSAKGGNKKSTWDSYNTGSLRCVNGYIIGQHFGDCTRAVTYGNTSESSTNNIVYNALYMSMQALHGLACGAYSNLFENGKGDDGLAEKGAKGTFSQTYGINVDDRWIIGNDKSVYNNIACNSLNDIYSHTALWRGWTFSDGEFDFEM